jgi:hypothetical protein
MKAAGNTKLGRAAHSRTVPAEFFFWRSLGQRFEFWLFPPSHASDGTLLSSVLGEGDSG